MISEDGFAFVRYIRRALGWLLFLTMLGGLVMARPAGAQATSVAVFYPLQSGGFPLLSGLLDVYDTDGNFVSGLQAGDLAILEEGRSLPVESLQEEARPLQLVVAVNPGPALGMRDAQGVTRFERVAGVLQNWANTRPHSNEDRLSLVSMGGVIIAQANYTEWANSLNAFRPNFLRTVPNLQTLTLAFETLAQHAAIPGGKRAILFITPHMEQAGMELAVKPFIERARQEGVRLFVWVVDAETYFTHPSSLAFQVLAIESGGRRFLFSGKETLPDPEVYFEPLRRVYSLTYRSQVNRSGSHAVRVQVQRGALSILSNEQSFSIELQPPQPALFVPAWQITRQPAPDDPWNEKKLLPEEQRLQVSVSFPDGYSRPLQALRLYVDGQRVAENLAENGQPPAMEFVWDLRPYTLSAQHTLVVEAVDSLGMIGQTQALPVTVTVILPPRGWRGWVTRYGLQLSVFSILMVLVFLAWMFFGQSRRAGQSRRQLQRRYTDPLTQPVEALLTPPERRREKEAAAPLLEEEALQKLNAEAYLVRLSAQGQPLGTALPLRLKELVLGSDPRQVNVVLNDSSVSPLHARLRRVEDDFLLQDAGSVAGTWVNYEPVGAAGRVLRPGDLIHFGRLRYRFERPEAPPPPEPLILLLDTEVR